MQQTTHQRIFENLGILVDRRRVDGDAVSLSHQVRVAVAVGERRVLRDVAYNEHSASETTRLLQHALWNRNARWRQQESLSRAKSFGVSLEFAM